jgi:hypothetical protein
MLRADLHLVCHVALIVDKVAGDPVLRLDLPEGRIFL